jgi:hypothetical protein
MTVAGQKWGGPPPARHLTTGSKARDGRSRRERKE